MTLRVAILGSTGSIGVQTLTVAAAAAERLKVVALSANRSLARLCQQAQRARPLALALEEPSDPGAREALERASPGARVWVGRGSTARLASEIEADVVVNAVVGSAGLPASLAVLERGVRLALANKETLVVGGPLVREIIERRGGVLIPIDSEHSAALQCLAGRPPAEVRRLTLTASGGALRGHPEWRTASPKEVLAHPVWSMGPRITVDSALLTNKGLELIEARWLFDLGWEQLDAVLHPQAVIHAIVTFHDGSSVLQAAPADMALPIQLALSWPEHWEGAREAVRGADLMGLEFAPIDSGRYPAFDVARAAGRTGGTAPCVLNAADEVVVQAFLEGGLALGQIPDLLMRVLDAHRSEPVESLDQLFEVDAWAREAARAELVRA